jgi:hypothetical protein
MLRKGHPRRLSGILAGELQPVIMGCETGVVSRPYVAMGWIARATVICKKTAIPLK